MKCKIWRDFEFVDDRTLVGPACAESYDAMLLANLSRSRRYFNDKPAHAGLEQTPFSYCAFIISRSVSERRAHL